MQTEKSDCLSIVTSKGEEKNPVNNIKYPFIECNRLIFNEEWLKINDKYEALGMDIPVAEQVEKYTKLPFSLNGLMLFTFFKDEENPRWTVLDFQEVEYLIDLDYETLRDKVLKIYGVEFL